MFYLEVVHSLSPCYIIFRPKGWKGREEQQKLGLQYFSSHFLLLLLLDDLQTEGSKITYSLQACFDMSFSVVRIISRANLFLLFEIWGKIVMYGFRGGWDFSCRTISKIVFFFSSEEHLLFLAMMSGQQLPVIEPLHSFRYMSFLT